MRENELAVRDIPISYLGKKMTVCVYSIAIDCLERLLNCHRWKNSELDWTRRQATWSMLEQLIYKRSLPTCFVLCVSSIQMLSKARIKGSEFSHNDSNETFPERFSLCPMTEW